MRKHGLSTIIVLAFLLLVAGGFALSSYRWPSYPNSGTAAVIEGVIEEIIYYDQDYGEIIVKCEKFHDVYRTCRFSCHLYSGTEVIWDSGTIPVSELRIGDLVRIRGRGAEPIPIGQQGVVGFRIDESIELLERIE